MDARFPIGFFFELGEMLSEDKAAESADIGKVKTIMATDPAPAIA